MLRRRSDFSWSLQLHLRPPWLLQAKQATLWIKLRAHIQIPLVWFRPQYWPLHSESLLLQFKRLANVYFLIIGILQSIPVISPLGPLTAWGPLLTVLGISMIREGTCRFIEAMRTTSDTNQTNKSIMNRRQWCLEVESSSRCSGAKWWLGR